MAKEQIRSLLEICFDYDGHVYRPIMLEMTLTRGVLKPDKNPGESPELVEVSTSFYVPVITLFSINSLGIENADVDFDIEITSQFSVDYEDVEDKRNMGFSYPARSVELLGKISTNSVPRGEEAVSICYDKAVASSFNINVEAGTMPLSKGLLEIIEIYTKSIHLVDFPEEM